MISIKTLLGRVTGSVIVPALLGVVTLVVFISTRQVVPHQDAYTYVTRLEQGHFGYSHILYLPAAHALRFLQTTAGLTTGFATLTLLSALSASTSSLLIYTILHRRTNDTLLALGTTLTVVLSPTFWFNATAPGVYAFHLLGATIALTGILPLLAEHPLGRKTASRSTLALAVGPSTHLSGIALAVPAAFVWVAVSSRPRVCRVPARAVLLSGFVLFLLGYVVVRTLDPTVGHYGRAISTNYFLDRLSTPLVALDHIRASLVDFLLYSGPIAPFLPVGFRALLTSERSIAWLSASWIGGYFALCSLIGTQAFGGYYLATTPVQGILFVAALEAVATTLPRALLSILVSCIPGILVWYSASLALTASALASVFFLFLVHTRGALVYLRRVSAVVASHVAWLSSATITLSTMLPLVIQMQPPWIAGLTGAQRAEIDAALAQAPADCGFLIVEGDPYRAAYWNHLLLRGRPDSSFSVALLDIKGLERLNSSYCTQVARELDDRLRRGRTVWIVGDPLNTHLGDNARRFVDSVLERYALEPTNVHASIGILKSRQ